MTTQLSRWFALYSDNHQNPVNKMIHNICVPLIFFSALGMLSLVRIPVDAKIIPAFYIGLHWIAVVASILFYLRHSFCISCGAAVFSLLCTILIDSIKIQTVLQPLHIYIIVFAVAWIGQFIGHKIEGRKPSFFTDMIFLLIGPAWIVRNILCKLEFEY
jgi:uncharacterized membrane protein YGL010W